ncbi:MAG: hypothetical protein HKN47_24915, partial [Pirellulaceae bacterium]|nr:hypothetical protein [Pirellulaceae bacterium]
MKTQWAFHHCDRAKQTAREYWADKTDRMERLLSNYRSGSKRICLTLYRHESRGVWELRCVLHLPSGTLTVEDSSPALTEVIDNTVDKLIQRIGRHQNELRRRHLHRRRKHRRRQFAAASDFLTQDAASNRSEAFVAMLIPYADQLYDHARRELSAMERDGMIPRGEWTANDLVDEVLVRASEDYEERFR